MSQNLSETQFHYVIKFVLTQQVLKSPHLLMESGDVVCFPPLLNVFASLCFRSLSTRGRHVPKEDKSGRKKNKPSYYIINRVINAVTIL